MGGLTSASLGDLAPIVFDIVRPAAPAAGADVTVTVPGNQAWEMLAWFGQLATSAVVANRRPHLVVDDQTSRLMRLPASLVAAASATVQYGWTAGYSVQSSVAGVADAEPFPDGVVLSAGYRLRTLTDALDVADQWTALAVWVRRIDVGVTMLQAAREGASELFTDPV